MKVYIAGPMTGRELYNFPAFDEAADRWRALGHEVTTPADITRGEWQRKHWRAFDPASDRCEYGDPLLCELFALDLAAVCEADEIALLPGYEKSKGARLEIAVAMQLGKPLCCAATGDPISVAVAVLLNNEIPRPPAP